MHQGILRAYIRWRASREGDFLRRAMSRPIYGFQYRYERGHRAWLIADWLHCDGWFSYVLSRIGAGSVKTSKEGCSSGRRLAGESDALRILPLSPDAYPPSSLHWRLRRSRTSLRRRRRKRLDHIKGNKSYARYSPKTTSRLWL